MTDKQLPIEIESQSACETKVKLWTFGADTVVAAGQRLRSNKLNVLGLLNCGKE